MVNIFDVFIDIDFMPDIFSLSMLLVHKIVDMIISINDTNIMFELLFIILFMDEEKKFIVFIEFIIAHGELIILLIVWFFILFCSFKVYSI